MQALDTDFTPADMGEDDIEKLEEASECRTSGSDISGFLFPARRFKVLKKREEQIALFTALHEAGSEKGKANIREIIIKGNMKLVVSIAMHYIGRGVPLKDMLQAGMIGLMRAIDLYEHERGNTFSTFAFYWIRQGVSRCVRDTSQSRPMHFPVGLQETMIRVVRTVQTHFTKYGEYPNPMQVYAAIKGKSSKYGEIITLSEVANCLKYVARRYESLDDFLPDGDGNNPRTYGEVVADRFAKPETVVEAKCLLRENLLVLEKIEEVVDQMRERDTQIVRLRWGLDELDPLTLYDIAPRFHLTVERIRQVELIAVKRITKRLGLTYRDVKRVIKVIDELGKIVASQ